MVSEFRFQFEKKADSDFKFLILTQTRLNECLLISLAVQGW